MFLVFLVFVCLVTLCTYFIVRPREKIRYYVIHVDGNIERRNHIDMMERLLGHRIHRVSAVTGSRVSDAEFQHIRRTSTHIYNKNEVGCYKSHQKVISWLVYEPCEYAVIFEDDFVVTSDTHNTLLQLIEDVPTFDIFMIGNNFEGSTDTLTYKVPHEKSGGSHGVLIKQSRARKIHHFLQDITGPIDDVYYRRILSGDLDGLVTIPSIVHVNTRLLSTLGHF
jgi:GR25 family glycosyltransferase involved in LPS biosynthesis